MMMQGKPVELKVIFNSDFECIYFSSLLKQSSLLDGTSIELLLKRQVHFHDQNHHFDFPLS